MLKAGGCPTRQGCTKLQIRQARAESGQCVKSYGHRDGGRLFLRFLGEGVCRSGWIGQAGLAMTALQNQPGKASLSVAWLKWHIMVTRFHPVDNIFQIFVFLFFYVIFLQF